MYMFAALSYYSERLSWLIIMRYKIILSSFASVLTGHIKEQVLHHDQENSSKGQKESMNNIV